LREGLTGFRQLFSEGHGRCIADLKLCQVSTMTVPPLVKRHALAAAIGFAAGALLWLLAAQLYAKAQDDGISVSGCEQSLGMDPLECA
jgi:hypothetical protein